MLLNLFIILYFQVVVIRKAGLYAFALTVMRSGFSNIKQILFRLTPNSFVTPSVTISSIGVNPRENENYSWLYENRWLVVVFFSLLTYAFVHTVLYNMQYYQFLKSVKNSESEVISDIQKARSDPDRDSNPEKKA